MEWIVSSAKHEERVNGKDAFAACVTAVKTGNFKSLGLLMSARPANEEETDDNTYFCGTESVCKEAGVWWEP